MLTHIFCFSGSGVPIDSSDRRAIWECVRVGPEVDRVNVGSTSAKTVIGMIIARKEFALWKPPSAASREPRRAAEINGR